MGKKRGKDKSPRVDDAADLAGPSCRHVRKATDQTFVKKLAGDSDWTSCQDCEGEENKENTDTTQLQGSGDEKEEAAAVWMCMKCGHRGCGRNSKSQHAIKHYDTPRSDSHCIVISMDNWSIWCYECDDEVQYSRTSHLAQLVTNIKKQISPDPIKRPQRRVKEQDGLSEVELKAEEKAVEENKENHQQSGAKKERAGKSQNSNTSENEGGVSVKGLSNLGNTCFFNAVIQNLSQTQLLRQTLDKVMQEKANLNVEPSASSDLEPIVAQLDRPGSLTLAMCQLLNEIKESKRGVVTPQELFTQVCKKAVRFKGFQQQDSQELLRYLLDGMRAEEIKRVSFGIMETLKQSRKGADGEQLKTLVKEYEKSGLPKNFVDQVFGGELTSTIMCQQCKTVSVVSEMFLDLSLPVSDEAYRKKNQKKTVQKTSDTGQDDRASPSLTNGTDDIPNGVGSKYQQKKAKKQAKKQAKHQKRQQKLAGRVTLNSLASPSSTESEQADPAADADAEDGDDHDETREEAPPSAGDPAQTGVPEQDAEDHHAVPAEKKKEEDEDSEMDCDSSSTSGFSNRFSALSAARHSRDGVADDEKLSDEKLSDEKLSDEKLSDNDQEGDSQLVSGMQKVSLDDAFIDSDAAEQGAESEDERREAQEYAVVSRDPELAFHTLTARPSPEKQECSLQSCLFQFTEVETLTQNNSLLCVTCTKSQTKQGKAEGSRKNIYTDALKQMLISAPPPVLTLHLKRFQQNGYSICKVNRHVHFPLVLDLAPFCAVKCKNVTDGEARVLYSLYGIVEHSGSMRSGHYTAYVKVRPERSKPSSDGLAADGAAEPPRGSWFHISDTSVQPVSESKVQSCQAYLLFYERIQ